MKAYITGPVRGTNDFRERFSSMEEKIRMIGDTPFNPAAQMYGDGWSLSDILSVDMAALSCCDIIVKLDGWEHSPGARAEVEFARATGKVEFDERDVDRLIEQKKERTGKF